MSKALEELLARAVELEAKAEQIVAGVEVEAAPGSAAMEGDVDAVLAEGLASVQVALEELTASGEAGGATEQQPVAPDLSGVEVSEDGSFVAAGYDFTEPGEDYSLEGKGLCSGCGSSERDVWADGTAACEGCGLPLEGKGHDFADEAEDAELAAGLAGWGEFDESKGYDFVDDEPAPAPLEVKAAPEPVETGMVSIDEMELLRARRQQLD